MEFDLKRKVEIKSKKELIIYAYLAAGTVGLMMADILGITEKIAYKYAIDLGIAFQLTNIARDILEDAKINRIYFPQDWIKITCSEIKSPNEKNKKKIIKATLKIINLSEEYYQSALKGLAFLSLRNRFAILTALIIYRQIGQKIVEKKFSNLYKREIIGFFGKFLCLLRCFTLFIFYKKIHKKDFNHNKSLHKYIQDIIVI